MEVTTSEKFLDEGQQAQEALRLHGNALDTKVRRSLEVDVMCSENLKKVESTTGLKFDVFENAKPGVAAFITVGEEKTYMGKHSLKNLEWALYAAEHEKMHKRTRDFMRLGNEKITVYEDQYDVLKDELQSMHVDLEGVNWMEGFTDLLTARKLGVESHSGYAEREVPAAEKLDDLCMEMTGESLAEAFLQNNVPLFTSRLRRLGGMLLMKKVYENLAIQDPEVESMRKEIELKMREPNLFVDSTEDAEKTVAKLITECMEIVKVRRFLG
jgi:hypothetical protein